MGRGPRTNGTLPDFQEWCRVTRHPLLFRGLTGCQQTPEIGASHKTSQRLSTASNDPLKVQYKIPQGHICKNGICIKTSSLLVKNISHQIVLGTPFLTQLYPFSIDSQGLKTK